MQFRINHWFGVFARKASDLVGQPVTSFTALFLVACWALSGPFFGFSDTWQLVINTSTTIITFLMVFLIQHTQNRDSEAMHLKLDELVRAVKRARNTMIALEDLDEDELKQLQEDFRRLAGQKTAMREPR